LPKITLVRSVAVPVAILMVLSGCSLIAVPLAFAFGAAASLGISYWEATKLGIINRNLPIASFAVIAASFVLVVVIAFGTSGAGSNIRRAVNSASSSPHIADGTTPHKSRFLS
jgi:uncharacterized protein YceK